MNTSTDGKAKCLIMFFCFSSIDIAYYMSILKFSGGYFYSRGYVYSILKICPGGTSIPGGTFIRELRVWKFSQSNLLIISQLYTVILSLSQCDTKVLIHYVCIPY